MVDDTQVLLETKTQVLKPESERLYGTEGTELTTGLPSIVFIAFLIALMHLSQCIPTFSSTTCAQRWLSDSTLLCISAYMHHVLLDSNSSVKKNKRSQLQLTAMVHREESRRLLCANSSNSFQIEDVHLYASPNIYSCIRTFLFHASNCYFYSPPRKIKHALYNSSDTSHWALHTAKGYNIGIC